MHNPQFTHELAIAISSRAYPEILSLLGKGADPNVRIHQEKGKPAICALEWAISRNHPMECIRAIVEAGARLDHNGYFKSPMSLLGVALRCGHMPAAIFLLDRVKKTGEMEWRAVRESVNPEMAAQILLNGTTARLDEKHPAKELCTGSNAMHFVNLLHAKGMVWAGLAADKSFTAQSHKQTDVFLAVMRLASRQDSKALDLAIRKTGATPLHYIMASGGLDRMLADPVVGRWKERRDRRGLTPLAAHLYKGTMPIVAVMLENGCVPPAALPSEDRVAYAKRVLGPRVQSANTHPCMDKIWSLAQQACLAAAVAPAAGLRSRNRL